MKNPSSEGNYQWQQKDCFEPRSVGNPSPSCCRWLLYRCPAASPGLGCRSLKPPGTELWSGKEWGRGDWLKFPSVYEISGNFLRLQTYNDTFWQIHFHVNGSCNHFHAFSVCVLLPTFVWGGLAFWENCFWQSGAMAHCRMLLLIIIIIVRPSKWLGRIMQASRTKSWFKTYCTILGIRTQTTILSEAVFIHAVTQTRPHRAGIHWKLPAVLEILLNLSKHQTVHSHWVSLSYWVSK